MTHACENAGPDAAARPGIVERALMTGGAEGDEASRLAREEALLTSRLRQDGERLEAVRRRLSLLRGGGPLRQRPGSTPGDAG